MMVMEEYQKILTIKYIIIIHPEGNMNGSELNGNPLESHRCLG